MCNRAYQSRRFREDESHRQKVMERLARADKTTQKEGWKKLACDPEKKNKYRRNSYNKNPLPQRMRAMLRRTLLGKHSRGTKVELGYDCAQLREHITKQLRDGMTWDNYSDWHIDHIKPISAFTAEGVTAPTVIHALSNLQPLWAKENIVKGAVWQPKVA